MEIQNASKALSYKTLFTESEKLVEAGEKG